MHRICGVTGLCRTWFLAWQSRSHAFRILRIPKASAGAEKYRGIHPGVVPLEELKDACRKDLIPIYEAIGEAEVRNKLSGDYIEALLQRTVCLNSCLLPEDYTLVFNSLRQVQKVPSGYTSQLNEGVRRLSANFTKKQIALLLRSYASLLSRSTGTITGLITTFNRNIDKAEIWQIKCVASSLATLGVKPTGVIEKFYNSAVAITQRHLKSLTANDLASLINSFTRQSVAHDEILHFVDIHAQRLIQEASNKNVALIVNAFARANRSSAQLVKAVTERMEKESRCFIERKSKSESPVVVQEPNTGAKELIPLPYRDIVSFDSRCSGVDVYNGTAPMVADKQESRILEPEEKTLNVIDVAIVFNSLTKLDGIPQKLLNQYIPWLQCHLNTGTPTLSLILLCHTYSRAGVISKVLFLLIARLMISRISALNCQQLGVLALSFSKAGMKIRILHYRIADEIIYRGTVALKFKRYEFDLQSIEHLMQAFSRINFKDYRLYTVLTTLLKKRLRTVGTDELNGETIASMLTSMVRRNVNSFVPLITEAITKLKDSTAYSTHALCRVLTAFSRLKVRHGSILELFSKEAKNRVNEFQIPVLANTLKALANLNCYNQPLIQESLKRYSLHLVHLSAQDIANVLCALNDYRYRNVSFLQKLIMCIKHRMPEFSTHQLHIILTRLAMLRTSDPHLYKELIRRIIARSDQFNEIQLADISVSYIYVLVHFDYLQRETKRQRETPQHDTLLLQHPQQGTTNVEGGIENAEVVSATPLRQQKLRVFMHCPMTNVVPYGFDDSVLDAMLWQLGSKLDVATIFKVQTVHCYLEHVRPDIYCTLSAKAKDTLRKCSAVNFSLAEYMLTSSSAHKELSHLLNLMGVRHRNEVQFGPYLIDIVPATASNQLVAIEYDGPTHFYAETTMRTAKSILKHEILESAGWRVIHVPYQEWAQLVSSKQKLVYLAQLRNQYEGGLVTCRGPIIATVQKRSFSSALDRKRRHLNRINEEILRQHLEMPTGPGDYCQDPPELRTPSSTDIIAEEICAKLMEDNRSIRDLDSDEEGEQHCLQNMPKEDIH